MNSGGALLVLSDAIAGQEAEFNDWYDSRHLAEVLALPGFVAARRFRSADVGGLIRRRITQRYVAVYEVEGPVESAVDRLLEAVRTGSIRLPACVDGSSLSITPLSHLEPAAS
jgi:hypothetical protein